MQTHFPFVDESINQMIERLAVLANEWGKPASIELNSVKLTVKPGGDSATIVAHYEREIRRGAWKAEFERAFGVPAESSMKEAVVREVISVATGKLLHAESIALLPGGTPVAASTEEWLEVSKYCWELRRLCRLALVAGVQIGLPARANRLLTPH